MFILIEVKLNIFKHMIEWKKSCERASNRGMCRCRNTKNVHVQTYKMGFEIKSTAFCLQL